ncbi:MAG: LysR family transcriptional regulator [Deltaproteobacteria bacterium]|nr:MAG: LysR family transcriptional regulator [Deltaproteobacteria bacterium]
MLCCTHGAEEAAMNLVDLDTFIQVAKAGSLTKAGKLMGIPKSTISRRVARLEKELGLALLQRKGRTFRLTEYGALLQKRCMPALQELTDVGELLLDSSDEPAGTLQLIVPPVFSGLPLFSGMLAGYKNLYPNVDIHVEATGRSVDLIEEGFDIAVRIHKDPLPGRVSLMTRRLFHVQASLYVAPDYLTLHGEPGSLEDVAEHPCVALRYERPMSSWPLTHSDSGEQVNVAIEPVFTSNEIRLLHSAILSGVGIGLLPNFLVRADVERGLLVRVLPKWGVENGSISLVWPAHRFMSTRVRAFIDYLAEHFASILQ